jgi:hypothetical protein
MIDPHGLALEHDFPVAWTFASIALSCGLGWTMLSLIVA